MTTSASEWFRTEWIGGVNHIYQNEGFMLRKTCTEGKMTSASKGYFRFAGKGTATKMKQGGVPGDVVPMNAGRTKIDVDIENYQAAEWIHEIDLDKMDIDERQAAQRTAAMALGRKHDSVIMAAVDTFNGAGAGGSLHGTAIGAYNAAWTIQKMQEVARALSQRDVPADARAYCCVPATAWQQAMSYQQFSNSQWTDEKTLDSGAKAKFWNKIHWFEGYEELFPTDGANGRRFYAWHESAVGQVNNKELNSRITYENIKTAWLANNWMGMNGRCLQGGPTGGIIECRVDNTSAIA